MVTNFTKITVFKFRAKIALRFTYCGRHTITTSYEFNEKNVIKAQELVKKIQEDIQSHHFDFSHKRYSPPKKNKTPLDLYTKWANDNLSNPDYYNLVYIFKNNFNYYKIQEILEAKKEKWNTQHYNRKKKILTDFYDYLLSLGYIKTNLLINLPNKPKNKNKIKNESRAPLTKSDTEKILEAFKNDSFCSKYSRVKHSFYYPFVYFLFRYGCRNEEIIGLKVKKISIIKKQIIIDEALAQLPNRKGRIQKSTKTGKARILPLTEDILPLIEPLLEGKAGDEYLFTSPLGSYINPQNFQNRIFYPILRALSISKRNLYCARHTFISRALEQQRPVAQVAYFAGNSPETIYKFYAHVTEIPTNLPSW